MIGQLILREKLIKEWRTENIRKGVHAVIIAYE